MPGGMGGMPGGMDPAFLQGLMSDPEIMAAFSDPKMAGILQEIMSDPSAISKYQNDPNVMKLMQKVMKSFGGGMPGGMPGGFPGGASEGAGASTGPSVEEVDEVD